MVIDKSFFLSKANSTAVIQHELPDGDQVFLRPITAKIYRDYKRSLRDKDGQLLPDRQAYHDELLVGRILSEPDGNLMFTDNEIVAGAFDAMPMTIIASLIARTYEMIGMVEPDEDREKNSSTTDSTEQS